MLRTTVLAATLALTGAAPALGQDGGLKIYPAPGLYGPESSSCPGALSLGGGVTVNIDTVFCDLLAPDRRPAVGERFSQLVSARFPVRTSLREALPEGVTRETMLSQTAVASLHLSRVDLWTVRKPAAVDAFVPITLSLLLTNALTGEVMFTHTLNVRPEGTFSAREVEPAVRGQFAAQLDAALVNLVDSAAARFRPTGMQAVVRGRAGDFWVIDAGRKAGIRTGDTLSGEVTVAYAGADYSIVSPLLAALATGRRLDRQLAQPIEALDRPTLLVVTQRAPEGWSTAGLTALAEDALGSQGLGVVGVNPAFAAIRSNALGGAGVAAPQRALPDFFVRVQASILPAITAPTNLANVRRRVQEARVFIEVIDHAGRIAFATQGVGRLDDQIAANIALPEESRAETALRNAMLTAARNLANDFQPGERRLPVEPLGSQVRIDDPGGYLSLGADATLLRRIGRISGVGEDVWAPVGLLEVSTEMDGGVTARHSGVEVGTARRGDLAAFVSFGDRGRSRRVFVQCRTPTGEPSVTARGNIDPPLIQDIAFNSFAGAFRGAVRADGFEDSLAARLNGQRFVGTDTLGALSPVETADCFEPVHQVGSVGSEDGQALDLTFGYQLRASGVRIGGTGLQQRLTITAIPPGASADYAAGSIGMDLAAAASALMRQAAASVQPTAP